MTYGKFNLPFPPSFFHLTIPPSPLHSFKFNMKLGLVAGSVLALGVYADVPTNCFVDDLWGDWTFTIGLQGDADVVTTGADYHNLGDATATYHFSFAEYNQVVNTETGATGEVTTIYSGGLKIEKKLKNIEQSVKS